MIPGDYCRCMGENCARKETCERYVAWRDKSGPRFISCAGRLCDPAPEHAQSYDHYIEVKKT